MNILKLVLKNLTSRKTRFAFTLGGIAVGIASLVILVSLGSGLQSQIHKQAGDLGANLIVTPKGWCAYEQVKVLSGNRLPDAIPPSELEKIEGIQGIEVFPYLTVGSAINNEPVPVTGARITEIAALKGWRVSEGKDFSNPDKFSVWAGSAIAESFKLKPGTKLTLRGQEFTIVGILESTGTGDDGVLFIPLKTAQEVYQTEDRVSFIAVKVFDIKRVDYFAQLISDKANVAVISDKQLLNSVLSVVNTVNTSLKVIAAVAILTAAFGTVNTMLTATYERKKEIGILKAIGSSNQKIFQVFLIESSLYGLIGGLIGLVIGTLASLLITPYIAQNEFTAFVSGEISTTLAAKDALLIMAGSVLTATLSGIYPALRAAKLTPVEAISYE